MVSVTFYGGVNEIGGNKFLLESENTRIFLDFGKNFAKEKLFFEEPYIKAREESHLLNLGILPAIKGLYKNDPENYELDGVLISHPHVDHYDAIRFIKDDFPIYCGEDTKSVLLAREFSSQSIGLGYEVAKLTSKSEEIFKEFHTFSSSQINEIGDLKFEAYSIDHSVPGSYGFIIETSGGNLVYTGDFRLHGSKGSKTLEFVEMAKESEPEILFIEGTHLCECKPSSEDEVKQKVSQIVSYTNELVLAGFATADVDRMKTFYEVAEECGRKLAISTKQAYIIHKLFEHEELELFSLNDPNVLIFQKEKKSYRQYEKELQKEYENIVNATDISPIQKEVILVASLYDMNEVAKIKPNPGSSYILSQSEPFDEEMEIHYDKLLNWLSYLGIPLYQAHASGHATPHEIKWVIGEISPKKVVPIHTERPELFERYVSDLDIEVVLPKEGGKFEF